MPKIKIGPLTYTLKYTNGDKLGLEPEWEDPDDETSYYGAISHRDQVVFFSKNNNEHRERLALLHEVIHAISEQYDAGLVEGQVISLTNGIVDTIDRNPWLRKKLWSK